MNKKTVTITINPEIHKQGIEQAKKDSTLAFRIEQRNFSNYVEKLILEDKKRIDNLNSNPY